jgi:hypothetical protein
MKIIKILFCSVLILLYTLSLTNINSQVYNAPKNKTTPSTSSTAIKYGALAMDRQNGFYYGFSANALSLTEAVKTAIAECNKKGGKCTLAASYSGTGCIVYRTSAGKNVGLAYGWGIGKTKEEADVIAKKECKDRTYGMSVPNLVVSCNDEDSGALNEIYNASREIDFLMGIPVNY